MLQRMFQTFTQVDRNSRNHRKNIKEKIRIIIWIKKEKKVTRERGRKLERRLMDWSMYLNGKKEKEMGSKKRNGLVRSK